MKKHAPRPVAIESGSEKDQAEIKALDEYLSTHFNGRAFILIYERENRQTATCNRNITAYEMMIALRGIADSVENFIEEQCPQSNN